MEDSVEFKTVRRCTVALETALKGLDRNMVDFLNQNGFITDDVCDQVLNRVTLLSAADKAHELVKGIKNRVQQDKGSYFVFVGSLTQGGVLYQPIVNILTQEYQRQLVMKQHKPVELDTSNQPLQKQKRQQAVSSISTSLPSTIDPTVRVSTSLPSTIDPTGATHAIRAQEAILYNLIRHCLPSLANSLYAESMIPEGIREKCCNQNIGSNERGVALLDSVQSKLEGESSYFTKFVVILESEPYLRSLAENLVKSYCAFSNAPTSNCPPAPSSAISHYRTYLKYVYGNSPISPNTKWPPSPSREFISLAMVEGRSCRDEYIGHTLQGNIKQVLQNRKEISIEQILEPVKGQNKPRLVLMEGAPGIGKSTLAWELCRKWEELSCMQQYSLVVLLRLREQRVQQISEVSHLFSYESKHKKSLVEEVSESQGSGVLFILDGFDELPKTLQKESFLLDLIRGYVLPVSTVLVTSRPSATAELFTTCRPQIQRHIEILGFTQESVEAYASSIFSSEPEKLRKFKSYILASKNPAINSLMYVPLNAAIIVHIYLDCKSDALLPHTLTELYTLLCLTILSRDLEIHVEKFEDLPADSHKQFLYLSKIAFEGILNEEVIFHTLPPGLVHFGFLNAVSALYGGDRLSYNFLHLTLQEFFAAYHISHLGSSGEVFKQHGKDKRWNVVLGFVAGFQL